MNDDFMGCVTDYVDAVSGVPLLDGKEGFLAYWNHAAASGLTQVGISKEYGGMGGGGPELAEMLRHVTRGTRNLGLSVSLMISQIVAHYMIGAHGTPEQQKRWLPDMAKGLYPAAFAVSEAGVGAHPSKLSTTGEPVDGAWSLNGEKSYISNGPMAGLVLGVAITGKETDGKNRFSTFLIPGEAKGVDHSDVMDLPFFKPAQHGSVKLAGVTLDQGALLGPEGDAYRSHVIPFRRYEDAMLMACALGAFESIVDGFSGFAEDDELADGLGTLAGRVAALNVMMRRCAELSELSGEDVEEEASALNFHFKEIVAQSITLMKGLLGDERHLPERESTLLFELETSQSLGANVSAIKKRRRGQKMLKGAKAKG